MARKGSMHQRGNPLRLLDVLELEGEATIAALSHRISASEQTVARALYRLRDAGKVTSRPDVGHHQAAKVAMRGYDVRDYAFTGREIQSGSVRNLWRLA